MAMEYTIEEKLMFVREALKMHQTHILTWPQIEAVQKKLKFSSPPYGWLYDKKNRVSRGNYEIPESYLSTVNKESLQMTASPITPVPVAEEKVSLKLSLTSENDDHAAFVPSVRTNYVAYGHHKEIKTIVDSGKFFPTYLVGLSGCGKTMMVEQVCAEAGRPLYRVNINANTDEDELIGGFRLIDGNTVWFDGPVVLAAKHGGILLLDEIDLGTVKLMCLQSLLEGAGIFIKRTNTWIHPKPGFNIFATANTKGRGDDSSKFIGTNIHNEAMLERFAITYEQNYADLVNENQILNARISSEDIQEMNKQGVFIDGLVKWADQTRKAYLNSASNDMISTRRLCQILDTFAIFKDIDIAIDRCLSRFDEETKASFKSLFDKMNKKVAGDVGDAERKAGKMSM